MKMRYIFSLFLALMASGCIHDITEIAPIDTSGRPVNLAFHFSIAATPIRGLDESSYIPMIHCVIESIAGNCTFDTGARGMTINSCFAAGTSAWGAPSEIIGGTGDRRAMPHRLVKELTLDRAIYKDVYVELNEREDCSKTLGLVGVDLLGERFFMDVRRGILSDQNPGITLDQGLLQHRGLLLVPVVFRGEVLSALVDSGAVSTFVDTRVLEKLAPSLPALNKKPFEASDTHGLPLRVKKIVRVRVSIAGKVVDNSLLAATDLGPLSSAFKTRIDMILGMNVIRSLNWGFDLKTNTWGVALPR